ncbi:MAG: hypothetical protein J6V22_03205 [Clostridia bacterium]|nr:hypothetical protein [Clostridia bacterium]
MTDVERVQKVEEFLEANPQIETFLAGFLVGSLVSLAVYGVCYLFGYLSKRRETREIRERTKKLKEFMEGEPNG